MFEKLKKLLENSYSPYSHFRVSCICIMKDGSEFNGVNIENVAYGSTVCAERSAILGAISNGYKKYDFKELHVLCDSPSIGTCCFVCRQVVSELMESDKKIICYNNLGESREFSVSELCPYPFDEAKLK